MNTYSFRIIDKKDNALLKSYYYKGAILCNLSYFGALLKVFAYYLQAVGLCLTQRLRICT